MKQGYFLDCENSELLYTSNDLCIYFDECEVTEDRTSIKLYGVNLSEAEFEFSVCDVCLDKCCVAVNNSYLGDIEAYEGPVELGFSIGVPLKNCTHFISFCIQCTRQMWNADEARDFISDSENEFNTSLIHLKLHKKNYLVDPRNCSVGLSDDPNGRFLLNVFNRLVCDYRKNKQSIREVVAKASVEYPLLAREMWLSLIEEFSIFHTQPYCNDFTAMMMLEIKREIGTDGLYHLLGDYGLEGDGLGYFDQLLTAIYQYGANLHHHPISYLRYLILSGDCLRAAYVMNAIQKNRKRMQSYYEILNSAIPAEFCRVGAVIPSNMEVLLKKQASFFKTEDEKIKYMLKLRLY